MEENSNFENNFYNIINTNTIDLDKDGILEYKDDTNFKKIDNVMLCNIITQKYGLESVNLDTIMRDELGISQDDEVAVFSKINDINGANFPCYYVFNLDNIEDPSILINSVENCIEYTASKYNNVKLMKSLEEEGYKFVFDKKNDAVGAAWCVAEESLIKVHCLDEEFGDDYVKECLVHELGHAVDFSLLPEYSEKNYRNVIETSYDLGRPMYLRLTSEDNNYYVNIKYRDDGTMYCESSMGQLIELSNNVINNNEFVTIDGNEYIVATKDDALNHAHEVFAETVRYNYVDKGVLLSRMTEKGIYRDDSYQLTTDSLTWFLSETSNEDISWYTDYLDSGS